MTGDQVDLKTGGECDIDKATGLPTSTCVFNAHLKPGVEASLMFYHNLTEVSDYNRVCQWSGVSLCATNTNASTLTCWKR